MNIWLKRVGFVVVGYVLSKIASELAYQLLYTEEISRVRAFVPTVLSMLIFGYFVYLAYKAK